MMMMTLSLDTDRKLFYEVIKSQNEHIGEASVLYNEQRWQRTLVLGVN